MAGKSVKIGEDNNVVQFCDAYLKTGMETIAHLNTYHSVADIGELFYVYALVLKDSDEIIYIGKGKGNRVFNHVKDAKHGRINNARKHNAINNILSKIKYKGETFEGEALVPEERRLL